MSAEDTICNVAVIENATGCAAYGPLMHVKE